MFTHDFIFCENCGRSYRRGVSYLELCAVCTLDKSIKIYSEEKEAKKMPEKEEIKGYTAKDHKRNIATVLDSTDGMYLDSRVNKVFQYLEDCLSAHEIDIPNPIEPKVGNPLTSNTTLINGMIIGRGFLAAIFFDGFWQTTSHKEPIRAHSFFDYGWTIHYVPGQEG